MIFGPEPTARRNFTITTKRIEWISAAGGDVGKYLREKKFVKTSKCRKCRRKLTWGDGTYNFDHRDNNSSNNSQRNCYLVCRNCHGKATKIDKRAERDIFGSISGYKTIKRKVSYKKPKSTTTKKKVTKKKVAKRTPKKVASKAKKSTPTKRARVRRSRK
ncbi:MAG: hypothetical protein A2Z28_02725 [Chloroflexi bacterium RBG_16_51_9]|nr:MAG: hypothetical protein A2Z28_02725 [Chloroflexi bacterium RBG_16_51_9]